jgi:hypothetical protein
MTGDAPAKEGSGGFLSGIFGSNKEGGTHCVGTEGMIKEGKKMMGEDMAPEVMDAAVIACAQKIEHYEICGYGTARAYAEELGMTEVERLLRTTLDEEYAADDLLTRLAVGKLNQKAERAEEANRRGSNSGGNRSAGSKTAAKKGGGQAKGGSGSSGSKNSSSKGAQKGSSAKSGSKSSSKGMSKAASKKGSTKAAAGRRR